MKGVHLKIQMFIAYHMNVYMIIQSEFHTKIFKKQTNSNNYVRNSEEALFKNYVFLKNIRTKNQILSIQGAKKINGKVTDLCISGNSILKDLNIEPIINSSIHGVEKIR